MARDPRTLLRMLARGQSPQTVEDVWMIVKRLLDHQMALEDELDRVRHLVLRMHERCGKPDDAYTDAD